MNKKYQGKDKFRIQPLPEFTPPFDETPPFRPPVSTPGFQPPQTQFFPPVGAPGFPPFGRDRFRRCLNRISVITLRGGNRIWFYPTAIGRENLIGYRGRQFNWQRASIPLSRIRSIDC